MIAGQNEGSIIINNILSSLIIIFNYAVNITVKLEPYSAAKYPK